MVLQFLPFLLPKGGAMTDGHLEGAVGQAGSSPTYSLLWGVDTPPGWRFQSLLCLLHTAELLADEFSIFVLGLQNKLEFQY